jgi:predicted DNA-binding transcriptional regulator AlpA
MNTNHTENQMDHALYKVSTAMKRLDVCRATIYRMAGRGELDLVKIGQRATRVTAESIERAIAAGRAKI